MTAPNASPSATRGFRLSTDTWAVLLSLALALLVKLHVIGRVPW
ncbi:hypothetical protein [Terriglobus roseus]|nr:hypothetical protein [Terriglobus roseus]